MDDGVDRYGKSVPAVEKIKLNQKLGGMHVPTQLLNELNSRFGGAARGENIIN